jgi:transcriptional regulator with XRE-family HTH domain
MPPLSPRRTRAAHIAGRQQLELRRAVGAEIRRLREDAGLSIRRLAAAAGISHSLLAAIEAGDVSPSFEVLSRIAGALGGRPVVRIEPGAGPLVRDHIQAAMLQGCVREAHQRWRRFLEVNVYRPVRGSIDLVLDDPDEPITVATEAHSQLRRLEQQIRWGTMKADALANGGARELGSIRGPMTNVSRLLLLRVTTGNLAVVRAYADVMAAAHPANHAEAIAALTGTTPWPGPALVWMDVTNGKATLRPTPPRGINLGC